MGDDGNQTEELNYRLAKQAGLSLARLTETWEPHELIQKTGCALSVQEACM